MKKNLIQEIKTLENLPNSIKEINDFRKNDNSDIKELVKILKKDSFIVSNILKISNSNLYGTNFKVETLNKAIETLGIKLTLAIAIESIVSKTINRNLFAYAVTNDDFFYSSALSAIFVDNWLKQIDEDLKNELFLPAFLQENGKFIISQVIQDERQTEFFLKSLVEKDNISACELEFTGYSCSRISANIFKHWDFSHNIIFPIAFTEDLENCPKEFIHKAQILNVVKILCDIRNPLSDNNIEKALKKVLEYNFDVEYFLNALDSIREKIEKNSQLSLSNK
ncbi:HDOD domain-containing protein [Arcobacter lacus]|uniref:HDOD domain-containing protein n=1 Tax=Arcobacter lacus TaxID=1912876 RepID=A0ABX5JIV5_9BACT|nr:HDOD domain-containing protein [Arcobacter lacus]MCT7909519.1 HDOD domain-containing protein [Arcobacter lacus]MCT7911924.1 HDOD domain-containing protein [Arcobacter lacus]PUE67082.1 HDOD domain-containing protein [Arcobacter lacus]